MKFCDRFQLHLIWPVGWPGWRFRSSSSPPAVTPPDQAMLYLEAKEDVSCLFHIQERSWDRSTWQAWSEVLVHVDTELPKLHLIDLDLCMCICNLTKEYMRKLNPSFHFLWLLWQTIILGGIKPQKFILSWFWGWTSKCKVSAGLSTLRMLWDRICSLLLPASLDSWQSLNCGCITLISAFIFTSPFPVSLWRMLIIGFRIYLNNP